MKITILTIGTRGDVQPYIALGLGLQKAGYDVTLGATDDFEADVTRAGLRFAGLGGSMQEVLQSDVGRAWVQSSDSLIGYYRSVRKLAVHLLEGWRGRLHELTLDADAILFHPNAAIAALTAERAGIPAICLPLMPWIPARDPLAEPLLFAPLPNIGGGLLHWLLGHLTHIVINLPYRDLYQRHCHEIGLPRMKGLSVYHHLMAQRVPHVQLYSSLLAPEAANWPEHVSTTGFCFMDSPGYQPGPKLESFLAAGPAPVYIGFGSMTDRHPAELARVALEAVERVGCRAILASCWGGLAVGDVPENVHVLSGAPHDWLFPRVAAVVHHGGIGTTAAGLRAGKPTVITPFVSDQPYWGRRVAELGVGPRPVARRELDAARLAQALQEATENPLLDARARALGQQLRDEDGVGRTIEVIGSYLQRGGERLAPRVAA